MILLPSRFTRNNEVNNVTTWLFQLVRNTTISSYSPLKYLP